MLSPSTFGEADQSLAQLEVGLGAFKQRRDERAQIKARAAHQYCRPSARLNVAERCGRKSRVFARGKILGRLDYIDQVVRHAAPLLGGDFGRGNLDAAIDLD